MAAADASRPISSMTGYARLTACRRGRRASVELLAVNNRYLKLVCRLPDHVQPLRPKLEAAIKKRVVRGAVTLTIQHEPAGVRSRVTFNRELAREYVRTFHRLGRELGLEPPRDLGFFATLPGVVQTADLEPTLGAEESAWLLRTLDRALEKLAVDRRREGRSLARDLKRRHRRLVEEVRAVRRKAPAAVADYSRRLLERMNELLATLGRQAEPADVLREVAAYAERADISEELTRLDAHLAHFAALLRAGGECGKRTEFLLQEVHREINTIGAKAGTTGISPHILTLKGEVEKIREQVQNIE